MFVVAGITGNTGAVVARKLLEDGHRVRGLTRDPGQAQGWAAQGVELRAAALDDVDALAAAFEGAEAAYLLAPPALHHPDPVRLFAETAAAARKAAATAGLKRLVFLSSVGAQLPSGTGPVRGLHEAEAILKGAAAETVFLRPVSFMENWRGSMTLVEQAGVLPTFYTDLDLERDLVAVEDIGETAASLLIEPSPPEIVGLRGPRKYTVRDVARAYAEALRGPVQPAQPPRDTWQATLQKAGQGEAFAALIAEMYDGLNDGRFIFEGVEQVRVGTRDLRKVVASWVASGASSTQLPARQSA